MSDSDCEEVLEKIYLILDGELSSERCAELLELAAEAAEIGNPFLISDAAVGAEMAAAALASAELNVRLNVGGLEDNAFAAEVHTRLDAIAARVGLTRLIDNVPLSEGETR